ncbi:MAG: hypothetical protein WCF46_08885, partial [Nitrososphaeraceae archaeon]
YSDFQSAILVYLASEERFFRTEEQYTDKKIQTRGLNLSSGTFFPNSIRIQIADIAYVIPISAKPVSRKLDDVSARLQELEQASLLQRGFPFYPGTEYESYSITVQGSRYISEYLYTLIPVVTNQTRLRRILEKVEGFEKAKSWLLELGPRFKDRPLEELVNELLVGVRQFPAIGINLLLVLGKEISSGTR